MINKPVNRYRNDWEKLNKRMKINNETGCLEWTGPLLPNGYAYVSINMKKTYLHRYSYQKHIGEIPQGLSVLHKCDNRRCCNHEHLFLGTQKDNMVDMKNKGRGAIGDKNSSRKHPEKLQGEKNGAAKLKEENIKEILEILKNGVSCRQLSKKYKVCTQTICNIKNGDSWRSLRGK